MRAISCALIAAACLLSLDAIAQTVTFGASVVSSDETLTTTLTWNAPGASGCVGAGHPAWDGDKTSAGTQALPPITLSGTYSLTLSCTFPGDTTATLRWVNPDLNTDGSSYLNAASTRILYGRSASDLSQTVQIDDPRAVSYRFDDLAPGEWFFAAAAVNSLGVTSALSNVASKVLTEGSSVERSVALTVNPRASAPTGTTVE
jgi:hypothetical protein